MDKQQKKRLAGRRGLSFLLATALVCTACQAPGKAVATTMHLIHTEGQVNISDGKGNDVEVREELDLYGGYEVGTLTESYAWINLDKVKLTKMDQDSAIEIQKNKKHLEIIVNEGSLFFHVAEPLADDETLNIRTSSMIVGIRGTCGWVEIPVDEESARVYLLEGTIRCEAETEANTPSPQKAETKADKENENHDAPPSIVQRIQNTLENKIHSKKENNNANDSPSLSQIIKDALTNKLHHKKAPSANALTNEDDQHKTVHAGEWAVITRDGTIDVFKFNVQDIPSFVREEIAQDKDLLEKIQEDSGLDVLNLSDAAAEQNPSATDNEYSEEDAMSPEVKEALNQYRTIIDQAASYFYENEEDLLPTSADNYQYALVQMTWEDTLPTLLLLKENTFGINDVRLFQYDPENRTMHQPEEMLMEGVASTGGFRGSLSMAEDGNGIYFSEYYSGTGDASVSRITLDGEVLHTVTEWEGSLETMSSAYNGQTIVWHDIQETEYLDSWKADAAIAFGAFDSTDPPPTEAERTETDNNETITQEAERTETDNNETIAQEAALTDGNRIVFSGTIGTYSHDEVVALQGSPDPNGNSGGTYRLIILDAPQTMTLKSGDGMGSYANTVSMINITYASGLEAYEGQHHTFSIDPDKTYWPSGTDLPLGQPMTNDIHLLD